MSDKEYKQVRGESREKNLNNDEYFSSYYFKLEQLCSFAQQIHDIHKLGAKNILEVGIGNGFTSSFLRRAGFNVTIVDINSDLKPDICCSIDEIQEYLGNKKFDLVVCCEVLEHLPFEKFEASIQTFRSLSDMLYLTLPNYNRVFGFGGFVRVPKFTPRLKSLFIEIPNNKKLEHEYFWELGSSKDTKKRTIKQVIKKHYLDVSVSRYSLNPYHYSFTCSC